MNQSSQTKLFTGNKETKKINVKVNGIIIGTQNQWDIAFPIEKVFLPSGSSIPSCLYFELTLKHAFQLVRTKKCKN